LNDKKNRPYTNPGFEKSEFGKVEYRPASYQPSRFAPSNYAGAPYVSGATMKENLIGKINIKDATAGVVGLGYVGLPLAVEIASAGIG